MVRNYKRKTAPYDQEDMKKAAQLVLDGTMGYKKAAKLYNLKWETVRDHVKKYMKMGAGRNTALSVEEETELADCLKLLSRWGFGLTRRETQDVDDYIRTLKRDSPFVNGVPGTDWLDGFMTRFPELKLRHPEQIKSSRAKSSANKVIFDNWFQLLQTMLQEHDVLGRPDRIYNVDKSGFPLDPRRIKVITQWGIQHLYRVIGGSGRETITVQGCARADGVMLPHVLYAAKNLRLKWFLFEVSVLNAYILYKSMPRLPSCRPLTHFQFHLEIARGLMKGSSRKPAQREACTAAGLATPRASEEHR